MSKSGPEPGSDSAKRISEAHRGSHTHDQQGGFASNPDLARDAGRKGGEIVKSRYGAEFYKDIGRKGGETLKRERGASFFAEIGKKGGERRGMKKLALKSAASETPAEIETENEKP